MLYSTKKFWLVKSVWLNVLSNNVLPWCLTVMFQMFSPEATCKNVTQLSIYIYKETFSLVSSAVTQPFISLDIDRRNNHRPVHLLASFYCHTITIFKVWVYFYDAGLLTFMYMWSINGGTDCPTWQSVIHSWHVSVRVTNHCQARPCPPPPHPSIHCVRKVTGLVWSWVRDCCYFHGGRVC